MLDVLSGLQLTIGSFFMILLLYLVYFTKERFSSIRNKLYRYMLIIIIILIMTEIIASFLVYFNANEVLNLFMYRIHWVTGIVWFSLLYFYSIVFLNDIKASNLFEIINLNKTTKRMAIIFLISFFCYLFIPFERLLSSYINYIPGAACYFVLVFCFFTVVSIIIYMLRNAKDLPKRKLISIWFMIVELLIVFILQFCFPTIAFFAIGSAFQMFFLYFNIENPDLKIIRELEILKNDIEKSNKAKSDFLSNMSHEIRTPMNAIVGLSSGIINDPNFDEESIKNDVKHIASAGNSLLDIINNILDISKIESGNEELEEKEYNPASIIMELSSIIDARLDNRPIKLIVETDNKLPSKLYGDSTKIFQILLNILTNAAKYTEVGKIKLSLTSDILGDKINLHFKISDTGYGIKKEDYDKMFSKFSRLNTATQNEIEGTGLGLVITKKYVDLMKGNIWFESDYGVGTTFYVDITQKIINMSPIGSINEPIKSENKLDYLNCQGKKVLIVDDNKLNIKVAARLLEPYKFEIESITSGKECIYKIKEGNNYDIIFVDHMMPGMDGIEVMHILKKLDGYKIPPIVALTANAITGMRQMYLDEGFDEYLSKPINISELNKIINKYFK